MLMDSYDNKPKIDKPAFGIVGCGSENPNPLAALAHLVNIEIADGYEPIGAPFFEPIRLVWCQAMYKRGIIAPVGLQKQLSRRSA